MQEVYWSRAMWTDSQSENITLPHYLDGGGKITF